jgi:hypothetical protein
MSARDSSNADLANAPGLLALTLGVVLGPIVGLVNQVFIYASNMWACGRGAGASMHVIPAICLLITVVAGLMSYRDWKRAGGGVEDEASDVQTRTRFLSILGLSMSVFSSLVILAQWIAIGVFQPCMRA